MSGLEAAAPADRAELAALIARERSVTFIAGGTDLLVAPRALPERGLIVDLSRTRGLAGVDVGDGRLCIGAATTLAALAADANVRVHARALAEAAADSGSVQIRNRATLGGNVATASPASDLTPALALFDASLGLLSRAGERRVDYAALELGAGEAIVDIEIALGPRLAHSAFVKLGVRDDLTIARLNLAVEADFDGARFGAVRFVAGAIAARPRRLARVEAALAGRALDAEALGDFGDALVAEVDAAIPGRASLAYKRRAILGLGCDLIARLTGRQDLEGPA